MSLKLESLQPSDAQRCTEIYFAAFQNAHSLGCFPRTAEVRTWWENMVSSELQELGSHWFKVVTNDDQKIVCFGKWQEPKPGKEPDTELPEWPVGADAILCDETFGAWAYKHVELMGDRGHWYLEMLATDPAYQGRGAGSMIMRWGVERADRENVEAYLDASQEGIPLYNKFGFREAATIDTFVDNERVKSQYRNVCMIRPVGQSSLTS